MLRKGTATCIVLASLIATPQRVRIQHGGRAARVRTLDERNAETAMRDPESFRAQAGELLDTPDGSITLELLPYAIARMMFDLGLFNAEARTRKRRRQGERGTR